MIIATWAYAKAVFFRTTNELTTDPMYTHRESFLGIYAAHLTVTIERFSLDKFVRNKFGRT